jgi:NAD(P)-dependent dehydrogenase (short-subunit alcohol dehydrogenase family)
LELKEKIAVITGAASGIGLALATRFIQEGAIVVISDSDEKAVNNQAALIGATGIRANATEDQEIKDLVSKVTSQFGRIDIFVSNTGIAKFGNAFSPQDDWDLVWQTNLMSQVYAAKYVLPQMIERKSGYLLNIAGAAGLALSYHSALYTTATHGAIGLAEWLAVTYKEKGIKVSVLCPGAVKNSMHIGIPPLCEEVIDHIKLAEITTQAIRKEQFMIATQKNIWNLYKVKSQDYDEYIDSLVQRRFHKYEVDK